MIKVLILQFIICTKDSATFNNQERLLELIKFKIIKIKEMAETLIGCLKHHIPLDDYRGQEFDNGSNVSGKIKDVQD